MRGPGRSPYEGAIGLECHGREGERMAYVRGCQGEGEKEEGRGVAGGRADKKITEIAKPIARTSLFSAWSHCTSMPPCRDPDDRCPRTHYLVARVPAVNQRHTGCVEQAIKNIQ